MNSSELATIVAEAHDLPKAQAQAFCCGEGWKIRLWANAARKASRVVLSRLKLGARHSTLQAQVDLGHPDVPVRIVPCGCDASIRMPAIVIVAVAKPLKPSIVAICCFTPRWSCSIRLFKGSDDRSFVTADKLSALELTHGAVSTRHSRHSDRPGEHRASSTGSPL